MTGETFQKGSPGYSVSAALQLAPERIIEELVGAGVIRLLRVLDPRLTAIESLRELAANLIDPESALKDPLKRNSIVGLLPLEKARELARRLELSQDGDVYARLAKEEFRPSGAAEQALLRFFGIAQRPLLTSRPVPSPGVVIPRYSLFDHQRRAALKTIEWLSEPPYKVLLHMPTGAGKTRTAMHVVAQHFNRADPTIVCWLAQTAELLEQAADEFEKAWSTLGAMDVNVVRFWGAAELPTDLQSPSFVVGGLGKMHSLSMRDPNRLLSLADRATLTVIDEAHQAIAPTYRDVLEALHTKRPQNALLGLSATPGRTWDDIAEDAKLAAFFDDRKVTLEVEGYDNPVRYLIEAGYLARPRFRTLNAEPGLSLSDADLQALQHDLEIPEMVLEQLSEDEHRNLRILREVEELAKRHRRIILFATTVQHARLLTAVLIARGILSFVVAGDSTPAERETAIRRFRSGDPRAIVICNYGVLTTGFDAPQTSAAVIARPTKSLVLYSQMVGRATRGPKAGGNEHAEIVTVVDPQLPGFGDMAEAFGNWEDVWDERD
jgi:superfamily II DNA or RNA helicase